MILPDWLELPIICGVCNKEILPQIWRPCPSSGGYKFFFSCHGKTQAIKIGFVDSKAAKVRLEPFRTPKDGDVDFINF